MEFCKAFNAQTQSETGTVIPVVITVYEDRSFTFVTKTPPAAVLIRQAIDIDKGSGEPNRDKVGKITQAQLRRSPSASSTTSTPTTSTRRPRSSPAQPARWAWTWPHEQARQTLSPRCSARSTASASTSPPRRSRSSRASPRREVRRVGRGARAHRPERPPRRRAAARHDRAAQRSGQGRQDRRVRPGRRRSREAEEAGADVVGGDDLAKRIEEGFDDFDVAIATPDMMSVVGRLGRILGPVGQDAEPEGRHRDDGRRAKPSRSPSPARSSTAPTAPRSCTW